MNIARFLRHLFVSPAGTRRRFSSRVLDAIDAAIRDAETRTAAEIRFVIETDLPLAMLWREIPTRERAVQLFSVLRVWDTELRCGVLIYVLDAENDVEIVADRAAAAKIPTADWQAACATLETHFRAGRFEEGAAAGVRTLGDLLARHFPTHRHDRDELPNQPVLL